jgi:hypothetical protein
MATAAQNDRLSESAAAAIATEFRRRFRNSEAFETSWRNYFAQPAPALNGTKLRGWLADDLLKLRAFEAGLETTDETPRTTATPRPRDEIDCYECHQHITDANYYGAHRPGCPCTGLYPLILRSRRANELKHGVAEVTELVGW